LQAEEGEPDEDDEKEEADSTPDKKANKLPRGFSGWLDRYRLYRERRDKKPHTAGVWVVYFSLAALPLFGLGQALIPVTAGDRRTYVFWLMVIYVGSGLGLLLTTSYLGLRRYLRQRKLSVPVSLTAAWLVMGSLLIATMLLIGALFCFAGCSKQAPAPTVDTKPFEAAIAEYCQAKGFGMKVDSVDRVEVHGETATAVCKMR
jgi:hypothetical protein